MHKNNLTILVRKAQKGCTESMDSIARDLQPAIYSYIYRMSFDENISNDISQETLLEMCRSIKNLRKPESFKPWLFKTAWGKLNNFYRADKKTRRMSIEDKKYLAEKLDKNLKEGLKQVVSEEIANTLVNSLAALDHRYRSVLVLRCYEDMSYSQIASVMDCSEITARVLFFRAKNKLKIALTKKGITDAMFTAVLAIFGRTTSSSQAAVTISAASMQTGLIASAIGFCSTKAGIALLSISTTAAILLTTATLAINTNLLLPGKSSSRNAIKSFHFVEQAWENSYIPNANLIMGKSLSKGAYEQWYFFPEGVDGPMFMMMQRWDPQQESKLCGWLLDGQGQKYYHSGQNIVYLMNNPLPSRKTLSFPSDTEEFTSFLEKIEGKDQGLDYIRDQKTGLLAEIRDRRFANAKNFSSSITYNNLDEKEFGNFRYNWHKDAKVIDERDDIHKQGWTAFDIIGQINGRIIQGQYKIPFVYDKLQFCPPLLKLNIKDGPTYIDISQGAFVLDKNNKILEKYKPGSFFKGLMRPWFGIHTVDSIRRDAAKKRVHFELQNLEFKLFRYQKRIVTLYKAPGYEDINISVIINIAKDRIDRMEFRKNDGTSLGYLNFVYPSSLDNIPQNIDIPKINYKGRLNENKMGILWLFELADDLQTSN